MGFYISPEIVLPLTPMCNLQRVYSLQLSLYYSALSMLSWFKVLVFTSSPRRADILGAIAALVTTPSFIFTYSFCQPTKALSPEHFSSDCQWGNGKLTSLKHLQMQSCAFLRLSRLEGRLGWPIQSWHTKACFLWINGPNSSCGTLALRACLYNAFEFAPF